ncbi:MAG: hypothetical protein IKX40_03415 [Thermoguttaceae bacterium]|nr:hypothetical protein [Thermoguttaceae bacterium]
MTDQKTNTQKTDTQKTNTPKTDTQKTAPKKTARKPSERRLTPEAQLMIFRNIESKFYGSTADLFDGVLVYLKCVIQNMRANQARDTLSAISRALEAYVEGKNGIKILLSKTVESARAEFEAELKGESDLQNVRNFLDRNSK